MHTRLTLNGIKTRNIGTKAKNEQGGICVFRKYRYGVQISVGVRDNRPVSFGDRHEEPFDQSSPRLAV